MSLMLSGSSHLNFLPCEGETWTPAFQLFSPQIPTRMSDHLFGMQSWTHRALYRARCWAFSWRVASLGLFSPVCSVMAHVLHSLNMWLVQLEIPLCLLTPSSPSFGGRGRTPAAPFHLLILAVKCPVANPVFAKDLVPCNMCSCRGCDIWAGQGMLLGRRREGLWIAWCSCVASLFDSFSLSYLRLLTESWLYGRLRNCQNKSQNIFLSFKTFLRTSGFMLRSCWLPFQIWTFASLSSRWERNPSDGC